MSAKRKRSRIKSTKHIVELELENFQINGIWAIVQRAMSNEAQEMGNQFDKPSVDTSILVYEDNFIKLMTSLNCVE